MYRIEHIGGRKATIDPRTVVGHVEEVDDGLHVRLDSTANTEFWMELFVRKIDEVLRKENNADH